MPERPSPTLPYNGRVVHLQRLHENLMILRVRPDDGIYDFRAGQYTTLGLYCREPRIDGVPITTARPGEYLVRRAYSFSCPLLDENGQLVTVHDCDFFEFYIARVARPSDNPPLLTPRLFALNDGRPLFVGRKALGTYTLDGIRPENNVLFVATGTGEAPHNAMLAELLKGGHQGRIGNVVSVRYHRDLAYLPAHEQLQSRYSNYRYVPLTTREPENLDPGHPGYVGKRHVQDLFVTGEIADRLGWNPQPGNTHVFLCGNPAMIGRPRRGADGRFLFPEPAGMMEVLWELGFRPDQPRQRGNVHFEKYW